MTSRIVISSVPDDLIEQVDDRLDDSDYKSRAALGRDLLRKWAEHRLHDANATNDDILDRLDDIEDKVNQQFIHDNTEPSDTATATETTMLVPTDSGTTDLTNPDSDVFTSDDVALELSEIPADWAESPAISGTWTDNTSNDRRGRKHVVQAAIKGFVDTQKSEAINYHDLMDILEVELGMSTTSAKRAIEDMVSSEVIYPHPTAREGLFSDRLMTKTRLALADKTHRRDADALTKKEEMVYEDNWDQLLPGFSGLKDVYYEDEEEYKREAIYTLRDLLKTALEKDPNHEPWDDNPSTRTLNGEEQVTAFSTVISQYSRHLVRMFDGFQQEDRKRVTDITGKALYMTADDKGSDELSDLISDLHSLIDDLNALVDQELDVDLDDEDMTSEDALDLFDWDSIDDKSQEDVEDRREELLLDAHPDQGGSTSELMDVEDATDILKAEIRFNELGSAERVS